MKNASVQMLAERRHLIGQSNARKGVVPPEPRARPGNLRLDSALHVALMLLLIRNGEGRATSGLREASLQSVRQPADPPSTANCTSPAPLTLAHALHETGEFLQHPVNQIDGFVRDEYGAIVRRCPPPPTPVEEGLVAAGDAVVSIGEGLANPALPALVGGVGALLKLAGDELEGKPLDAAILDDVLGSLPGFGPHPSSGTLARAPALKQGPTSIPIFESTVHILRRKPALDPARLLEHAPDKEGIVRYRDAITGEPRRAVQVDGDYYGVQRATQDTLVVAGVALEREGHHYMVSEVVEEASGNKLRCRRAPGGACALPAPRLSRGLSEVLRSHLKQGITEEMARHRGIAPTPGRPGWHERVKDGRHHVYLKFGNYYFPVKTHEFGNCRRMTVHLPRTHAGESRGARLVDIVVRMTAQGEEIITQTDLNQERGLTKGKSCVYEDALRHAAGVQLNQAQRAALLRYHGTEEVDLDAFMHDGAALAYRQREFEGQIHSLKKALAKIPPYAGRVYRAALLPTHVLEHLVVGNTVYIHTFVRANGDRQAALAELEGRDVPRGQEPMLLNIVAQDAHPTGLYTLRDEGEVLFNSGRVYRVAEIRQGELVLEEVSALRQRLGRAGAIPLRLG